MYNNTHKKGVTVFADVLELIKASLLIFYGYFIPTEGDTLSLLGRSHSVTVVSVTVCMSLSVSY